MTILTDQEKSVAASEVRELITSSGQTAVLARRESGEELFGSDEGSFGEVCAFPLEFSATPPTDLAKKIDGEACVLPELDVRVGDRVHLQDRDYRVQTVVPQSLFGIVTHKSLELVALYDG